MRPINILFCSVPFRPSMGGIETVSAILAEQFHSKGHTVTLVTQTPAAAHQPDPEPYPIVRQPTAARLWSLVRAADVVFHNNISLQLAWPLLVLRRPWVVAHHTWIPRRGAGRLKRWLLPLATNISASRPLAADLPVASAVLPNPYQPTCFRLLDGVERRRDVVFLGRLVSDKGADVLIDALALLRATGHELRATIIGDGPEAPALAAKARSHGLGDLVDFTGGRSGEDLVRLLNGHRFVVVPSLWEEPFGLVALEALACGCVPVVARSGGLPDAAGPCGRVFAKGDSRALAAELAALLADPKLVQRLLEPAREHLSGHLPEHVARRYLHVLNDACLGRRHTLAA